MPQGTYAPNNHTSNFSDVRTSGRPDVRTSGRLDPMSGRPDDVRTFRDAVSGLIQVSASWICFSSAPETQNARGDICTSLWLTVLWLFTLAYGSWRICRRPWMSGGVSEGESSERSLLLAFHACLAKFCILRAHAGANHQRTRVRPQPIFAPSPALLACRGHTNRVRLWSQ